MDTFIQIHSKGIKITFHVQKSLEWLWIIGTKSHKSDNVCSSSFTLILRKLFSPSSYETSFYHLCKMLIFTYFSGKPRVPRCCICIKNVTNTDIQQVKVTWHIIGSKVWTQNKTPDNKQVWETKTASSLSMTCIFTVTPCAFMPCLICLLAIYPEYRIEKENNNKK